MFSRSTFAIAAGALVLLAWGLLFCPAGSTEPNRLPGPLDTDLFASVVQRIHAGGKYYATMGEELSTHGYPTRPFLTWRLPTLTMIEAAFPSLQWSVGLLTVIGISTTALWFTSLRLRGIGPVLLAIPLVAAMLPSWAWLSPRAITLHDLWAGQLIALSLAAWSNGHRRFAWFAAAAALAIRELTLPFVIVMAGAAWLDRRRHEAAAWIALAVLFGTGLSVHAWRVAAAAPPGGYSNSWIAAGGWCFALATARADLFLLVAPQWLVASVVPMMLAALWFWPTATGRRVAAIVTLYLAAFMLVGRPFNWYWGLLTAPLLPVGVLAWLSRHPASRGATVHLQQVSALVHRLRSRS